jgi:hypothetical protein
MLILGAVGVWAILGAQPAHAQLFGNWFRKSPPPVPPAQRVSELVTIVRTDGDERKRTAAVEELRNFDTKAFPEIVPVLAESAIKDTKPGVRAEAINSLVRIRPISNIAGQAIEGAAQHDEYWRNRMSAQTALMRYRMSGYVSPTPPPPAPTPPQNAKGNPPAVKLPPQTGEPPLADAAPPIVYYDQNGKQIAPPRDIGTVIQAPTVPALPTANPRLSAPAISPIPSPNPYAPPASYVPPTSTPTFTAPTPPVIAPQIIAPPVIAPPVVTPTLREPEATEPTFRPLNRINPNDRVNSANAPRPTPPVAGPSLDLPTLPTLPTAPRSRAPLPTVPTAGPSLEFALPMPTTPLAPLPTNSPPPLAPQPAPVAGPAPF